MRGDLLKTVFPEMRYLLAAATDLWSRVKLFYMRDPTGRTPMPIPIPEIIRDMVFWWRELRDRENEMNDQLRDQLERVGRGMRTLMWHADQREMDRMPGVMRTILSDWHTRTDEF